MPPSRLLRRTDATVAAGH